MTCSFGALVLQSHPLTLSVTLLPAIATTCCVVRSNACWTREISRESDVAKTPESSATEIIDIKMSNLRRGGDEVMH